MTKVINVFVLSFHCDFAILNKNQVENVIFNATSSLLFSRCK